MTPAIASRQPLLGIVIGQKLIRRYTPVHLLAGGAKSTSWCELCVTLDHDTADCPYNIKASYGEASQPPATRSQLFGLQLAPKGRSGPRSSFICIKYNKYGGDCKYGASCRYKHICSSCKGNHPRTKCSSKQAALEEEKSKAIPN